jgi:hypothetical protein
MLMTIENEHAHQRQDTWRQQEQVRVNIVRHSTDTNVTSLVRSMDMTNDIACYTRTCSFSI